MFDMSEHLILGNNIDVVHTLDSPPRVGGVPSKRGRWYDYLHENTPSASLRFARPPNLRGQSKDLDNCYIIA